MQDTLRWVSPFGNLRINAHLQLPEAYRSLSRPSSAPDAKAFPLRPFSLDLVGIGIRTLRFRPELRSGRKLRFAAPFLLSNQNPLRWAFDLFLGKRAAAASDFST